MNTFSKQSILIVLSCAGGAAGLANGSEPATLPFERAAVQDIAHIYFNLATGERVVSLNDADQTSGADTGSSISVWSTGSGPDCMNGTGYTTDYYFAVDNPGSTSLSTGVTLLDFGDIESDTVVDCLSINWTVAHLDTDTDLDSIGDGVEELAGEWTVWDADNGRFSNQSTRMPLINFLFFNLPGNIASPGFLSGYTADIDLVGFGTATDLSFEIGDSDGDCQSAAYCNSSVLDASTGSFVPIAMADNDLDGLPDGDLDGDGLFDFSWTVRFYQPGIGNDFDSDNDTGTAAPTDADSIGVGLGFPVGGFVNPGGVGYGIDPTVPNAGTGAEDRFVLIASDGTYGGDGNFGGFRCPIAGDPFSGIPAGVFEFELFGPGGQSYCYADFNNDGVIDFFDITEFLACWQNGYPGTCDCDGDGDLDFFDISCFLQRFLQGCDF